MTEGKVLAYSEINEAIVFSAVPALLRRRPIAAAFQFVEVVGVKRTESLLSARITRSPARTMPGTLHISLRSGDTRRTKGRRTVLE